jgi:hypothetical protein
MTAFVEINVFCDTRKVKIRLRKEKRTSRKNVLIEKEEETVEEEEILSEKDRRERIGIWRRERE